MYILFKFNKEWVGGQKNLKNALKKIIRKFKSFWTVLILLVQKFDGSTKLVY
jgi:hypothetical protein